MKLCSIEVQTIFLFSWRYIVSVLSVWAAIILAIQILLFSQSFYKRLWNICSDIEIIVISKVKEETRTLQLCPAFFPQTPPYDLANAVRITDAFRKSQPLAIYLRSTNRQPCNTSGFHCIKAKLNIFVFYPQILCKSQHPVVKDFSYIADTCPFVFLISAVHAELRVIF